MSRALVLALVLLVGIQAPGVVSLSAQEVGILHIVVRVTDGAETPIPRHALLISDNPSTSTPRRVLTGPDGTVDVRLRPGNYTIESDEPVAIAGKGYQWTETLDIRSGATVTLELSERNAEIGDAGSASPVASAGAVSTSARGSGSAPRRTDPGLVVAPFQTSVARLWTPRLRGSAFLIDAAGLLLTNQKVTSGATRVEVQLATGSSSLKIEGRLLASDTTRDVAVVWVNPQAVAGLTSITMPCDAPAKTLARDDEVLALGVPLRDGQDRLMTGYVSQATTHEIQAELRLSAGAPGGPLFTPDGTLVGLTTLPTDDSGYSRRESRAVPITDACEVVVSARAKMSGATPPSADRLPLEPAQPFPLEALKAAFTKRGPNLLPYTLTAADFEVAFITPLMVYAAQQPDRRTTSRETRNASPDQMRLPAWSDFANWSDYMADVPPVLLVRVTPKLDESFWTTVARGAARTQGMNLPPMKKPKAPLSRLRAFCGDVEVAPIHPFAVESQMFANETLVEGLYVFDPSAFGPQCGPVKLQLYSEKEPEKADTKIVDPTIVEKLWQDFAPVRSGRPGLASRARSYSVNR